MDLHLNLHLVYLTDDDLVCWLESCLDHYLDCEIVISLDYVWDFHLDY